MASASKLIHTSLLKKWGDDQEKLEQWYSKFTSARRAYLQKVWDHDPHCVYCRRLTIRPEPNMKRNPLRATYEHMIPVSRGGTENRRNATLSCSRCNTLKGSMTHEEFLDLIKVNPGLLNEKTRRQREAEARRIRKEKKINDPKFHRRMQSIILSLSLLMFNDEIKNLVKEYL